MKREGGRKGGREGRLEVEEGKEKVQPGISGGENADWNTRRVRGEEGEREGKFISHLPPYLP